MEQILDKKRMWLQRTTNFVVGIIFVFLFFLLAMPAEAGNQQITFQGKLTNSSGNTVSNGTYYVKLTIYDAATGGTCQYTASSTCAAVTSTPVTVTNGIFSINLGDTSAGLAAVSSTLFSNSALYLGITVCSGAGTGCDSEMTPRKRITASPYAFNADYLSGLATSTIGGQGSYVPVTDSSGNFTISNKVFVATTTAGQFGVGTTTVPTGVKSYIEGTTASDKLLVVRGNSSQTGNLQEWQNNAGTALVSINSAGGISTSSTLTTFGNTTIGGHLYPSSDNLYDIGASSTQWRYGNFQGGVLIGNGTTSSTLVNNSFSIGQRDSTNESGLFHVDSSGSLSTSGTIALTNISHGVVSSTASLLRLSADGANQLQFWTNSSQRMYIDSSGNTFTSGTLQSTGNTYFYGSTTLGDVAGDAITVNGRLSTLNVSDGSTATSSLANNSLTIRQVLGTFNSGYFNVDSSGNVFATGSIKTFGNVTSTGIIYASGGLISSASSSFISSVNISGVLNASNTVYLGGDLLTGTGTGNSLDIGALNNAFRNIYASSSINIGSGASSSTLMGNYFAMTSGVSSTVLNGSSFVLGSGSNYNSGIFTVDSLGGISTSGTLNVSNGANPIGSVVSPTHKGSLSKSASVKLDGPTDLAVVYPYAYVVSNVDDALEIIDISNPASPAHKGSLSNGSGGAQLNDPNDIFVSGNYAYVASCNSNTGALEIIDISNPASPVHKGAINHGSGGALLDCAYGVFVSGNYAYVAAFDSNALEIIDVSNPTNPVHKGSLTDGTGGANLSSPFKVFVSGNYAYVVSYNDNALEIIDISNPANPIHKGVISGVSVTSPYDLFVDGKYAYVAAASGYDRLVIIDVSNPASPSVTGSIANGTGGALLNDPRGLFVSGNYAYVTANTSDALEIIDVFGPSSPAHKSSMASSTINKLDGAVSVFVSGNYAYVVSDVDDALEIIDVSGATISNAQVGSLLAGTLQVNNFAKFDQGLLVRGGLNVGGSTQLFGDVSIGGGRATSTNMGGGGITFFTNQTSSTLTSRVLDATGSTGFIFNSGTSTWTGADRTLVSFQTGGTDKFLFAADGSVIFNKAASYNSGYFSIGSTGSTSVSGTLQVFGGASTGGLKISADNSTTTFTSFASGAGAGAFVFDTNSTLTTASSSVLFSVRNNGSRIFSIDSSGYVTATGTIQANNTNPGPGDVAEFVNLVPGETVEVGDVLIVDENGLNQYRKSDTPNARNVAGVISGTGAFLIGASGNNRAPLALAGIVKVKVTDENGPVAVGDYLTTASKPGYAMRFDANAGISAGLVGMALEPWASGDGKITILVNKGLATGNAAIGGLNTSENGAGQLVWGNDLNLHLLGRSILDVLSIKSQNERWMIDEEGYLVMKVQTQQGDKMLYGLQSGQDKEVVFSGSSQLEDGVKKIELSAIDKEMVDTSAPIKVSVTLTGEANGVFVTDKSYEGFTVRELNSGTSDATFDWMVIAKRRAIIDEENGENINEEASVDISEIPIETAPETVEETPSEDVDTIPNEEASSEQVNNEIPPAENTEDSVIPQEEMPALADDIPSAPAEEAPVESVESASL